MPNYDFDGQTSGPGNDLPSLPTHGPQSAPVYHKPVLVAEVLAAFQPIRGRLIVDGTLGGGGHSAALLAEGAKIIGLDRDGGAIGYCIQHLVVYDGDTVRLVRTNFRDFGRALDHLKITKVDGILLDLGVSSAQIDRAERGFSFQKAGGSVVDRNCRKHRQRSPAGRIGASFTGIRRGTRRRSGRRCYRQGARQSAD